MFFDTASKSLDIHLFLQEQVEFIEGEEVKPEQDAEITSDGRLYILNFDTSCEKFPMYDPALICNITDFFELEDDGYIKSKKVYERFLPEYLKNNSLTKAEINAFYDLIALYHFALQATIVEIFGIDCVDDEFLDRQLSWLEKWKEQCEKENRKTEILN